MTEPELTASDLRAHYRCPLGHYYSQKRGERRTPAMARGQIWHRFVQSVLSKVWYGGLVEYNPAEAENLMRELLGDPKITLSVSDRQWLMRSATNWCATRTFAPQNFFHVMLETSAQMEAQTAGKATIKGRLDLVSEPQENLIEVTDFTTAHSVDEDAHDLISLLNVWLAFNAYPTHQAIAYRVDHPRLHPPEASVFERDGDYEFIQDTLSPLVDAIQRADNTDGLSVNPGSWCHSCMGVGDCPAGRREVSGVEDTRQAEDLFESVLVQEAQLGQKRKALKSFCQGTGETVQVGDQRYGPEPRAEAWQIKDRQKLWAVLDADGYDPNDFIHKRTGQGFNYARRTVGKD